MSVADDSFPEVPQGKMVCRATLKHIPTGTVSVTTAVVNNRSSHKEAPKDSSNGFDDVVEIVIGKVCPPSLEEQDPKTPEVVRDELRYERVLGFWSEHTITSIVPECVQSF